MATFYVLPPRDCLDQAVADLFTRLLPGLPLPADGWAVVSEQLAASWPADVFLVPRDDLPEGEPVGNALASGYGAESGDRVVEVRRAGAPRAWVVGGAGVSGMAAAR
ncbi:MAG TPA: hypothetical protein VMZ71_12520 [Gemmataceae bacterium]|nr:hypothetical protein [Gemmataceae bacterium]